MRPLPEEQQILSVADLTSHLKRLLEDSFPAIWVKGEISNIRYQSSGHIYFSLKDAGAQISAVMFRGNAAQLEAPLQDGQEVVAFGNISVYEPRGTYQLIVRSCIDAGAGRLQAEFERLKRNLEAEGLFDSERKKEIPTLPRRVGVITSPTGAAIRDFLSILKRREWNGEVFLFPAVVQGKEGAPDIEEKIRQAKEFANLDLLVLTRGGGSLEDLWNFNEESVVRAIADCEIPSISAVGHEIDFVLTDFAADFRAETPSAAAELISSGYIDAKQRIENSQISLTRSATSRFDQFQQQIGQMQSLLTAHSPNRVLEYKTLRLDDLSDRLKGLFTQNSERSRLKTEQLAQRFQLLRPDKMLLEHQKNLDRLESALARELQHQQHNKENHLEIAGKRLKSLGVEQVLKRGFSIVRDAKRQKIISQAKALKPGMKVEAQFADGSSELTVSGQTQGELFELDSDKS